MMGRKIKCASSWISEYRGVALNRMFVLRNLILKLYTFFPMLYFVEYSIVTLRIVNIIQINIIVTEDLLIRMYVENYSPNTNI